MQQALSDFRVENESVIFLAFSDGSKYRVSPSDLTKYLQPKDIQRVQEALALRKQFMKRVLPPTAMMVLFVSAVMFAQAGMGGVAAMMGGTYQTKAENTEQIEQMFAPLQMPIVNKSTEMPKPAHTLSIGDVQAAPEVSSTVSATVAGSASAPSVQGVPGSSQQRAKSVGQGGSIVAPVQQVTNTVDAPVQRVAQPVQKVTQPVLQKATDLTKSLTTPLFK